MDEIDRKIIQILKQNGRATYNEIGKVVGLSEGAVRRRIKDLVNSGIIKRFTLKLSLSEGAEAIVLVSINPLIPTSEISAKLLEIPNVDTVYEVTGEYDIATIVSAMSIAEVNECIEKIRKIDGVIKTNTMIILRSW
ncbi:MAG: HTH-type transcriptional regulator LysM [Candidatus Bathyarchaeia archaeon]|nr:Lrp/AsnC family transcriptional regulator [Candidatus Bathyarchaeota archaeon]